jgi:hypothetical protein
VLLEKSKKIEMECNDKHKDLNIEILGVDSGVNIYKTKKNVKSASL